MTQVTRGGSGCSWLLEPPGTDTIRTPETITDEHGMIGRTAREFVAQDVLPHLEALEAKDWSRARALMRATGALGLLGTDVPEDYGGVGLDKLSSIVVAENVALPASFASMFGGQTNLTIMPLLCFGTEAQKQKYLPRLVSGELVGAYALSESGAGSDALSARARATPHPEGGFVLSGEKMWITNGGFADVFIVFAKVNGEHFTAFLVDRAVPGVSTGHEEHKMGLHGSSTTALVLQDVRLPEDSLLGEIGKGHKVAFNTLNYGRLKLGAMCCGGGKAAVGEAARYAADRKQFGRAIASFGAIRHKLGEMVMRTYVVESMLYRTAGMIDERLESHTDLAAATLSTLEDLAVEASILKVAGSEMIDYVLDENVQIHGGNGYVRDYPAERQYRDARVNRIFEGTNEINRLLIAGTIVRRAMKGDFPLLTEPAPSSGNLGPAADAPSRFLAEQQRVVASFKRIAASTLRTAVVTYGAELSNEQEILGCAADILIETYGAESAVRRAEQAASVGHATMALQVDAARLAVDCAAARVARAAAQAVAAMSPEADRRARLASLRAGHVEAPVDAIAHRRRLADAVIDRGAYPFGD